MKTPSSFPPGPLTAYRERATIDFRSLKLNLFGLDNIEFEEKIYKFMENSPTFQRPAKPYTLDEHRRRVFLQTTELLRNDLIDPPGKLNYCIAYDSSIPVVGGIPYAMIPSTVFSLGTERHFDLISQFREGHIRGAYALTEVAHGTNAKGIRTTATYDVESQSFVINTPDFEAAKFLIGCIGKQGTHVIVYAQLITPDGVCHGLNLFVIPVRDMETMLPLPGVTIGDLGEKTGLNGVDNGYVMFHNVKIPRINLLNKMGDVTPEGKFVSPMKDPNKRFGASLGILSFGRITITNISATFASLAMVVTVRYCAVRKQFGPSQREEWPVIEYQTLHGRLMPWLATTYALVIASRSFLELMQAFQVKMLQGVNSNDLAAEGLEMHALSSAAKPYCSWIARDCLQDCREMCGGIGYLKMSRLGDFRADHDANCTYEGENNVLTQQASNWLLGLSVNIYKKTDTVSPLGTINFMARGKEILQDRFTCTTFGETVKPHNILNAMQWLICHYFEATSRHIRNLKMQGKSQFTVRNESQTFLARSLSLVYAEHTVFKAFLKALDDPKWKAEERLVLEKMCSLFGASTLERRLGDLYAGGYAGPSSKMDQLLRGAIVKLSRELVDEAVALVDVLAPPDFILNSPLGMSDGRVYEHLEEFLKANPENFERAPWWREMLPSKL